MALIGYARVSTKDQTLSLQLDALRKAGVEKVFCDQGVSGAKASRPELDKAVAYLRESDTLVVWKLDRLGRSTVPTLSLIGTLADRGVAFKSITEQFDTSTPAGKAFLGIIAVLAEMERGIIRERVLEGMKAARARGRVGGRPVKLSQEQKQSIRTLHKAGDLSMKRIAQQFGVSRSTAYTALSE